MISARPGLSGRAAGQVKIARCNFADKLGGPPSAMMIEVAAFRSPRPTTAMVWPAAFQDHYWLALLVLSQVAGQHGVAMSISHVVVGCAAVICGIWGFTDIVRYLRAGRSAAQAKVTRQRSKTSVLFFRSAVPFIVGVILIFGAERKGAGSWVLSVIAVVLLAWLIVEEGGSRLRSRRESRADASGG